MKLDEISAAINNDRICEYNSSCYIVCGYQLLKRKGKKMYSVGLQDMNADSIVWADPSKVKVRENEKLKR